MAENKNELKPIAYIKNGFNEKFGVPRQSGLAASVKSEIIFEKAFCDEAMFRGIEQYSHLWLVWGFSENAGEWSPTVRPPKLGGNKRVGVFASRSPFRPNNVGLSCVKLDKVKLTQKGVVLVISGADLKNGTPVFDVKPYLPYVDSIPDAKGGFSEEHKADFTDVEFFTKIDIDEALKNEITEILSLDPRPQYQDDEGRIYGMNYKNNEIKFTYKDGKIIVTDIQEAGK